MSHAVASDFRAAVANRIGDSHQLLASRWLDQLKHGTPGEPDDSGPGDPFVGHAQTLIPSLRHFFERLPMMSLPPTRR